MTVFFFAFFSTFFPFSFLKAFFLFRNFCFSCRSFLALVGIYYSAELILKKWIKIKLIKLKAFNFFLTIIETYLIMSLTFWFSPFPLFYFLNFFVQTFGNWICVETFKKDTLIPSKWINYQLLIVICSCCLTYFINFCWWVIKKTFLAACLLIVFSISKNFFFFWLPLNYDYWNLIGFSSTFLKFFKVTTWLILLVISF